MHAGRFAELAMSMGAVLLACAGADAPSVDTSDRNTTGKAPVGGAAPVLTPRQLEFHLLYVHGVQSCADDRRDAQRSLDELQAAIDEELPTRIADYEAEHPGTQLRGTSAHANLYTATPSRFQPSDSPDALNLDDWEIGDPGCSAVQQGEPCTTAFEWRYRLVQEIERSFGPDAQNIILIGHSTGARAAFEITANVGSDGPESFDWGVQSRILGWPRCMA
jgi:hypothetical protein